MRSLNLRGGAKRLRNLATASVLCSLAAWLIAPTATQNCAADGETRTLHLYHTHTLETIDATFRVDGHYDPAVLHQLNHFLRDWRNDDEIDMDPRLFDAIWEAYRSAGATDRIQIYSAYRSPETNAMLRRRSKAVAEHSQHMLGKAMDTTMPGFPMSRIRDAAMKLEHGGVGWYPSANFVHIDVGGVRSWPRMPYDQLMALFPDGKTVHIASNGQTLPGYEQARLELAQRGQTDLPPAQESGGFFAWLFGGGTGAGAAHEDEEDRRVAVASAAPPPAPAVQQAQAEPAPAPQPQPAPEPVQVQAPAQPEAPPAAAIAYAPQAPEQPLDGRVQLDPQAPIAGQDGLGQQPQPQPQQVASLDPTAPDPAAAAMPLPPRRPADLAEAPDVPLPPVRPEILALATPAAAAAGSPDAASEALDLPLRPSSLPPLISGDEGAARAPDQALAFAGEPLGVPAAALRPLGLRAALRRHHQEIATTMVPRTAPVAVVVEPSAMVGAHLTGLRRAAHQLADNSAL